MRPTHPQPRAVALTPLRASLSPRGVGVWLCLVLGGIAGSTNVAASTVDLTISPGSVAAAAGDTSQLDLAWTDNATNEGWFRVERKSGTGAFTFVANVGAAAGSGSTATFRDMGLAADATYTYRVRAENLAAVSGWSNEASGTTTVALPLSIASQPTSIVSLKNTATSFNVVATGQSVSYQWRRNGGDLLGETGSVFYIASSQATDAGTYTVRVSNPAGSFESTGATLNVVTTGASRLANLSARALVGTGDGQLVPGFSINGGGRKKLLLRAVGPRLATFGVGGFLADPKLSFYSGTVLTASNDNWWEYSDQAGLETTRLAVSAFSLLPLSKDSSLVVNANAGSTAYTLPTSGVGDTTGVALVELYDADAPTSGARLSNLSTRAFAGVDENVLNPGFVITGDVSLKLLIRGVGPGLTTFGVANVLAAPTLTLYRVTGTGSTVIATNSRWEDNANLTALNTATTATFAFPLAQGGADTAMLLALPPGSYTVQVTGANRTTGIALVELYVAP